MKKVYSNIKGWIPRQFRNIRGKYGVKHEYLIPSWWRHSLPFLQPWAVDPLAPQDHTQGTQQSKSCLCNNSVWQQLIEQLLFADGSQRKSQTFIQLTKVGASQLHTHSYSPGVWGSKSATFSASFNSWCPFCGTFRSVNHQQPMLNTPLFVHLDSAWTIMPETV